ncbi:hypothetical protein [Gaetbulibacter aestuarii]|uniref:Uncharacterized protein n=1 Tax=Gaetbulibacter aestuarii TaxID=1502358 RepID=A0ABW7MZF8_9FLAO
MKENDNKYLNQIAEKVVKNNPIESPSGDFTSHVMFEIERLENSSVTAYKPLISKTGWTLICTGFLAVFCLVLFTGNSDNTGSWLSTINLNGLFENKVSTLFSHFYLPKTLLYPMVLFAVLVWIQLPILRNFHKKRYQF